jgi:Signal peptidase, peptidase S26
VFFMPDDNLPLPAGSPGGAPPSNDAVAPGMPTGGPGHPVSAGAISAEPMNLPPIPLGAPAAKPATPPAIAAKKDAEIKDTFRELIETIVFVVVLVLMLKTFLAEAFVIPTGSMADTLLGYHHKMPCQQCGKTNLVNASNEADPQDGEPRPVQSFRCENCEYWNQIR